MEQKSFRTFLLVLVLVVIAYPEASSGDEFVSVNGVHLMLNGSPFYANGFNAYWMMVIAADVSQRPKVTAAFQDASARGLTIARTWAFSDGGDWMPLQISPGVYNEQVFQGLDFVVSEAKNHGIKLVLSLVNNWVEFGGKKQYVAWGKAQGQTVSADDDFFTNEVIKGFYKNHVKTVLTRRNTITGIAYMDDPTIMAWELINEMRCVSDKSGKTVQAWVSEMAPYVKSIDRKHLLEVGLEGYYGASRSQQYPQYFQVGTDFIENNQVPGIDFATVHTYTEQMFQNMPEADQLSFLNRWVQDHIHDAENTLHKPVLFAEFGKTLKGYTIEQRDRTFNAMYSGVYSSASRGGAAAAALFWQVLSEGTESSFQDGYGIVLSRPSSTADIIAQQSSRMNGIRSMLARRGRL
ncbi:hypothetical protein MLD38_024777 [Melastoma candidum]|uniref:Uncharacterized protein n=1 Tax=Melastoma candidum TaxID=119954 RepID=A0ACB9NUY0_9MYRT|nr:hypothetical protein MLD38_024777 [Melastoma candidum]